MDDERTPVPTSLGASRREDRLLAALVERGLLDSAEVASLAREEVVAWEARWGPRLTLLLLRGRIDEALLRMVHDELGARAEERPHDGLEERYELVRPLGAGAMGEVFLARDVKLGRLVALKLLSADSDRHVARCLREARAQARISHDGVCQVFEAGRRDGRPFIAMRYVDGPSLATGAAELTLAEKLQIFRDLALALHEAHGQGVIHRDVKPSNVLIERLPDGRLRPVLTDFGLAFDVQRGDQASQTAGMIGTPAFMSPEQARGEIQLLDRRSDVYSLGATLYFLLAGRPPFEGDNLLDLLLQLEDQQPTPLRQLVRSLPEDLEVIVLKCLAKDPSDRYESALALAEDIARHIAGEPIRGRRLGRVKRVRLLARRHPRIAGAGVAFALSLLVLGGFAAQSAREASRARASARELAELGRRLGQETKELEWVLRAERMLPLHDVGPAEARVRERLGTLRGLLTGGAGDGPIHNALGRGHLALGEIDEALAALRAAYARGERDPDLHWALGYALVEKHDRVLAETRGTVGPEAEAQQQELAATYLAPAREHLAHSRGAQATSSGMLEALIAYSAGDLERALRLARRTARQEPLFYEAHALAGQILNRWGHVVSTGGNRIAAGALFEAASDAYEAAARVGRSDGALYGALTETWISRMRWKFDLHDLLGPTAGALVAADRTIACDRRKPLGHRLKALIYQAAGAQLGARGSAIFLQRSAAAARATLERAPDDWGALSILGVYLRRSIEPIESQLLDPRPTLLAAVSYLERAQRLRPGIPSAANSVGVARTTEASERLALGLDPVPAARAALEAYDLALRLDPTSQSSSANAIWVLAMLAEWQVEHGRWDPILEARALIYLTIAKMMRKKFLTPVFNRSLLLVARLRHAVGAGQPTAELAAAARALIEESARVSPVGALEALADVELLLAQAAGPSGEAQQLAAARQAVERCLAKAPRHQPCLLLAIRLEWLAAAAGDAGALRRAHDVSRRTVELYRRSARAHHALAETTRRLALSASGDARVRLQSEGLASARTALTMAPELPAHRATLEGLERLR